MIRTFLAVEVPDAARAAMQARVTELAQGMPGVRFTAPETWHLTLAFLGELDDAQVAAAKEAAHVGVVGIAPFTLRLGDVGTFGPRAAPRVIWLGLVGDLPVLQRLQQQIVAALRAHDLRADDRFAPHITLARLKQPPTPEALQHLATIQARRHDGTELPVTGISVMRSDLSPAGAQYTCLQHVAFPPA